MWWCCGKPQKEANGCKFSKHESKDDEEEEKEKEEDKGLVEKRVRCHVRL
jgi:hypothetical protein